MEDISLMVGNSKFNYRVGAIFEYDGKIIIEKSKKEHWGVVPGGRVKMLEDTKEALIREIKEEMHYDISNHEIKLHNIIENFFKYDGVNCHELFFVYKIKLEKDDEIVNRKKEEFINYDSNGSWYEFVDIKGFKNEDVKPDVLKEIVYEDEFRRIVVRDK